MKEFNVSREKDDKDLFIQKEKEFFIYDSLADKNLHIDCIMGAFSCVKAMFNVSVKQLPKDVEDDIRLDLANIGKKYRDLVPGGERDNWDFFAELQNDVNLVYAKLKEALK